MRIMRVGRWNFGGRAHHRWRDSGGHFRNCRCRRRRPKLRRGHLAHGGNLAKERFVSLRPGTAKTRCVHGVKRTCTDRLIDARRVAFHRGSHHHNWAGRMTHDQAR